MPPSSTTAWPTTNPIGYEAWKIQHSIPRSVFEYYSLRSLGLIQARSEEEWEDEISGYSFLGCCIPQDSLALADGGELRIKVRFGIVDWSTETMREGCKGVEFADVPPSFLKRKQRTGGKERKRE